jgi:hypothetical protein
MNFLYKRAFGTHNFEILEDDRVIATNVKEKDAIRIVDALSYYEGE